MLDFVQVCWYPLSLFSSFNTFLFVLGMTL